MRLILGALVLVLASACTAGEDDPAGRAAPTPTQQTTDEATPDPPKRPRKRLEAAQLALSRAEHGAYELTVYGHGLDHPLLQERGRFNMPDEVMEITRTVQNVGAEGSEPSAMVMHVRGSRRARYLQVKDSGRQEDCWVEFGSEALRELTGVDLSNVPEIPVPVSVVLTGEVAPRNRAVLHHPGREPGVTPAVHVREHRFSDPDPDREQQILTDAASALQTLGLSGRLLFGLDPAVARVKVPLTIVYFHRYPDMVEQIAIDGPAIVEAARAAGVSLAPRVKQYAALTWVRVTFSEAPTAVVPFRPEPDELIPPGGETCAAAAR